MCVFKLEIKVVVYVENREENVIRMGRMGVRYKILLISYCGIFGFFIIS